jgi:hypothetical protein
MNGEAAAILMGGFNGQTLYGDGMNLYGYLNSKPVDRRDPAGLFLFGGLLFAEGLEGEMRAQDAARVGLGAAFLMAMAGSVATSGQWGVGGGLTGAGFELFIDGIEAMISGEYSLGESLMQVAEATATLAVFSISQADAVNKARHKWRTIVAHFDKISTGGPGDFGSGPQNWLKEIKDRLNEIAALTKHMGRRTTAQWLDWIKRCLEAAQEAVRTGGGKPPPMPG